MKPLEMLSLALDVITIILTIAMFLARPRIGGELGRGMRILVTGFVVMGIGFLVETTLFITTRISLEANEVVHRLLIGLGFIGIIAGFNMMRRAFK